MASILITNSVPTDPILRQIPRRTAKWCNHRFLLSTNGNSIDAWVVYDNLLKPETNRIERCRTMLITAEPPSVRRYRSAFTSQFGSVRTSHASVNHPHLVRGHEAQLWHFGMHRCRTHSDILDYDTLALMSPPKKPKLLSVISSNKVVTEDHRQRLRFIEQIKAAFGDQVDVFGRGIRDVPDKADAIWEYKYHIVLENDHTDYYMSEKLPDSLLGWSFPFYSGGAFAESVFPTASFARIDMYKPAASIATIRSHIQNDSYDRNLVQIADGRRIVLDELNLFAVLCNAYDSMNERLGTNKRRSNRTAPLTTLLPKKKSVRLSMQRFMRAISVAA